MSALKFFFLPRCKDWGLGHHLATKNLCKRRWETAESMKTIMTIRLRLERSHGLPASETLHQTFYKLAREVGQGPIFELVESVAADIIECWAPWTRDILTIGEQHSKSAGEVAEETQRHARIRDALAIGKQFFRRESGVLGLRPGTESQSFLSCIRVLFAMYLSPMVHFFLRSSLVLLSSSSVPADDEDNLQEWIERRKTKNAAAEEDRVDGPRDDRVENVRDDRADSRRNNLRPRDEDGELSELNSKKQQLQRKLERLQNDPPNPRSRSRSQNPLAESEAQVEKKVTPEDIIIDEKARTSSSGTHESEDIIIDGYKPAEAQDVFRVMQMEPDSEIDRRIAEAEAALSPYDLQVARRDYLHRLESGVYDDHKTVPRDQQGSSKRQRRF